MLDDRFGLIFYYSILPNGMGSVLPISLASESRYTTLHLIGFRIVRA